MTDDQARDRFIVLNAVRLTGAAVVVVGTANIGKHWVEPADTIGSALLLVGALLILVVPRLLARRWSRGA